MEARPLPLGRLHDSLLLLIVKRCTLTNGARSLAQTCKWLCCLVRGSPRLRLRLRMRDMVHLLEVPDSRAFQDVKVLTVDLEDSDLQAGCWGALGLFLVVCSRRWPGLEQVNLYGGVDMPDQPLDALAAPLAALKGAANLRELEIGGMVYTHDLPHLQQLTQVTRMCLHCGPGAPLVLNDPPCAPLAAMANLRRLELPYGWSLTDDAAEDPLNDHTCPLALPPNLTSLQVVWLECAPGSLWRHIAACTALEELELTERGEGAPSHPSWALHELAGSLGRLKKLVVKHEGVVMRYGNPVHRLAHLLRLLYIPDGDLEPEELDAAEELALPPVPVPVPVPGFDRAAALYHMMLPPPNMQGFSSLEVLQLPGSIRSSWWMVCSEPDHWEALAGCRALRQLEGLHACRPPPAGVEFPGVTRLEVTVAPGDAVQVLAAFPALRQLKLTSVLLADQGELPLAQLALQQQQQQQQQQQTEEQQLIAQQLQAAAAASQRAELLQKEQDKAVLPDVTHLTLNLTPGCQDPANDSASAGIGAADDYCSVLWRVLPGLTDFEVSWPAGVVPPSVAPLTALTSLVIKPPSILITYDIEEGLVAAASDMVKDVPGLQQLVVQAQISQEQWEVVVRGLRQVRPGLTLELTR